MVKLSDYSLFAYFCRNMEVGDTVSVLDEDLSGVVTSIHADTVFIETLDGFAMQFQRNELVVEDALLGNRSAPDDLAAIVAQKEIRKKPKNKKIKAKNRKLPPMEVDLHIHQLTDAKHLSNFEMLNIQLEEAKRQLEFAMRKKIQRIVFIHGVGQGVLRIELEYLFKQYESLKYYDADYKKYGVGATEVYIFQNAKTT